MTHLAIDEDYGCSLFVVTVEADTRRELSRKVQEHNPGSIDTGCGHDCSGRVCGRYARLLRAYRVGRGWVGLVEISISRDV